MILDVDIGNSRTKWRLSNEAGAGAVAAGELDDLGAQLAPFTIERVRASCVVGAAAEESFSRWCEQQFAVTPEFARVKLWCGGVTVGYRQPERLGVDRWLAMLAAYDTVGGACAVLDAGSALTVDFIDHTGQHLGGLILPGARLMAQALSQTSGVQVEGLNLPREWRPGQDTLSCVENAVAATFAGVVDQVARYGEQRCGKDLAVLVCGGDAQALSNHDDRLSVHADLVLDGLAVALGLY